MVDRLTYLGNSPVRYTGLLLQLGGYAPDRTTDELWVMCKEASFEKMKFPHTIEMPCGETWRFESTEDILNLPIENIKCPCGDPKHFIVEFVDMREEASHARENET